MARKPTGRRKIEMEHLPSGHNRDVALSRRRAGLFKKALEICIVCGCQIAIVVYAMVHKLFAIGHSSAASTSAKFLNGDHQAPDGQEDRDELAEAIETMGQLDISIANEQKNAKAISQIVKEDKDDSGKYWWLQPREELTIDEIAHMMHKAKELEQLVSASSEIQQPEAEAGNNVTVNQDDDAGTSSSPKRTTEKAKGKAPMEG